MTTLSQPLQALAKANEVKHGWLAYRRDLAAMQSHKAAAEIADMLDTIGLGLDSDATNYAGPVAIERVLATPRGMGARRVRKLFSAAGTREVADRPWTRVRDLKPHQAFAIGDALRRMHPQIAADAEAE